MSSVPKILYAEDNENDFFLLKYALTQAGVQAELLFTSSARGAVDVLSRTPEVAMLLLDLHLPDLTGMHVLDWLRSEMPGFAAPVLLLTGDSTLVDEEHAARLRVFRVEEKPRTLDGYYRLARGLGTWLKASTLKTQGAVAEDDTVKAN
jgi:CheY-like chemotaxis protein